MSLYLPKGKQIFCEPMCSVFKVQYVVTIVSNRLAEVVEPLSLSTPFISVLPRASVSTYFFKNFYYKNFFKNPS